MTVEQEWIRPEGREELVPGDVGPRRAVPARIERPEYVDKDEAVSDSGPKVQTAEVIEPVHEAARIATRTLQAAGDAIVSLRDDSRTRSILSPLAIYYRTSNRTNPRLVAIPKD